MKNLRDSYKFYKKLSQKPIDTKEYLVLNGEFNKFIVEKILEGNTVSLPARMGTLTIQGKKQKVRLDEEGNVQGLAPDWVGTKALWERSPEAKEKKTLLYHMNSHTDNYRYKYLWSKLNLIVKNRTLYSLKMTRTNKRAVSRRIKNGVQYKTK